MGIDGINLDCRQTEKPSSWLVARAINGRRRALHQRVRLVGTFANFQEGRTPGSESGQSLDIRNVDRHSPKPAVAL